MDWIDWECNQIICMCEYYFFLSLSSILWLYIAFNSFINSLYLQCMIKWYSNECKMINVTMKFKWHFNQSDMFYCVFCVCCFFAFNRNFVEWFNFIVSRLNDQKWENSLYRHATTIWLYLYVVCELRMIFFLLFLDREVEK